MEARAFSNVLPDVGKRPAPPVRLQLADGLLATTQAALRDGSGGVREAIVLWAGRPIDGATALISHLLLPEFVSGRDFLTIPKEERFQVAAYLRGERVLAFADMHTHPEEAFLSKPDRRHPFSERDGFYTVVIPDFGTRPPGEGWRFYEVRSGVWDEVHAGQRIDGWRL